MLLIDFFRFYDQACQFPAYCKLGGSFGITEFIKGISIEEVTKMGCCGCFGFSFSKKPKKAMRTSRGIVNNSSQEFLLDDDDVEDEGDDFYNGDMTDTGNGNGDEYDFRSPTKRSEEILMHRVQHGLICREFPVKETHSLLRSEVSCRRDFLYFFLFLSSQALENWFTCK